MADDANWEPYNPDDDANWEPLPSSGGAGAFARGAAEGAIPATGGLAVGLGAGALTTAATGNPLAGLGVGLAAGLGAGEGLSRGQDWIMEKLGMREGEGTFSRAQQLADEVEHPYLKAAGAAAPSALLLSPVGTLAQRGLGAAIGGGVSAADELIREGTIDPGKVGIGALTGFALPSANRPGRAIEAAGARAGAKVAPYVPASLKRAPEQYGPPRPPEQNPMADDVMMTQPDPSWREQLDRDFPEIPPRQGGQERPITEPSQGEQLDRDFPQIPQGKGGTERSMVPDPSYREKLDQDFPRVPDHYQSADTAGLEVGAWEKELQRRVGAAEYELDNAPPEIKPFLEKSLIYAQDNLAKMQRYGKGKGDPTHFVDASLGPAGDEHPFTYDDANKANALALNSRGSVTEQPRVSENPNTGNPFGAAGANRIAARPQSRLRDYTKDRPLLEGPPKIDVDRPESPIAEDIQAALKALEPPRAEPTNVTPEPPRPPEIPQQSALVGPPPPEVTGAVTPRPALSVNARPRTAESLKFSRGERAVIPERDPTIARMRDALKDDPVRAAQFERLSPAEQSKRASEFFGALPKVQKTASEAERDFERRPKTVTGAKTKGGEIKERKDAVLNAVKGAVEFMRGNDPAEGHGLVPEGTTIEDNKAAIFAHAGRLWDDARLLYGGKNPLDRKEGYQPNLKTTAGDQSRPPEWNLVKLAHDVVQNPGDSKRAITAREEYVTGLDLKGETGPNLEAESATSKRSFSMDDPESDFQGRLASEQGAEPQVEFEKLPRVEGKDNTFVDQYNELVDYVKKLHPDEWSTLSDQYEGKLASEIQDTNDPRALMAELKDVVEGRAADTNNYTRPIDKGIASAFREFIGDNPETGGGGFLDFGAIGRDLKALANRLRSTTSLSPAKVATATTKVANAAKEYMDFGRNFLKPIFTGLNSHMSQLKFALKSEVDAATADKAALLTRDEGIAAFRTKEDNTGAPQPKKITDYMERWVNPGVDILEQLSLRYNNLARTMQIPGWEKLKDPKNNGPGFAGFMPHVLKDEYTPKQEQDVVSNSISPQAGHAMTRSHFTLQNLATGDRILYHLDPDKPGEITLLRNGAPRRVTTGALDMAEIGTDIPMTVKGVKGVWRVDNAKVREVRDNAGRNPDSTPKVDFIESPHLAVMAARLNIEMATARLKVLQGIFDSPIFAKNTTLSKAEAEKNGWLDNSLGTEKWVQHKVLPQMKDRWMPPAFDWHFQDFVKQGLQVPESVAQAKDKLDRFSQNSAKLLFALGGPIHGFNVWDKWFVGRGKDWFTPQGWKGLGKFPEAFRAVLTQNDTMREITIPPKPGDPVMNMLYVHTVTKDVLPEAARKLGEDMTKNAWAWDPFAKKFGITTPQLMRNFYRSVSSAPLWLFTDTLGTQRYLELRGQGLSRNDAINKANKSIDDYVAASTYVGEGQKGRLFQQFLTDPSVSWFTAFHQHTLKMLGDMVAPFMRKATATERVDAAAQMALLAGLLTIAYPAISAGYAALTGNKHSEFERRGVSRVAGLVGDLATGKKGYEDIARNVWTPSSVADTAIRIPQNKRFDDKHIVNPADMRNLRNIPKAAGQLAEFGAQQYASPYKILSTAAVRPGATPGSVAQRFGESVLNLKTPTPQAVMRENKGPITQMRQDRQRVNHPTGFLESAANWTSRIGK